MKLSTERIGEVQTSEKIISSGDVETREEKENGNLWFLLHWQELQLKFKFDDSNNSRLKVEIICL